MRLPRAVALLVLLLASSAISFPAEASALFGSTVVKVAKGDLLNARSAPSAGAVVQTAYPNGTDLSLTGRCTGNLHLDAIGHLSRAQRYARLKTRWCEIWHDPNGTGVFKAGWVYGRYIYPH